MLTQNNIELNNQKKKLEKEGGIPAGPPHSWNRLWTSGLMYRSILAVKLEPGAGRQLFNMTDHIPCHTDMLMKREDDREDGSKPTNLNKVGRADNAANCTN
jgi:hypothetical protein